MANLWYQTTITQPFKWGWNPGSGGAIGTLSAHSGIDLAEANGTPITSAVAGTVLHAGPHAWGGQVDILFANASGADMVLSYLHLSQIARGISPGVSISAGQLIGLSGGATWSAPYATQSRYSNGPHLHFELWVGDRAPYTDQSPWRPDDAHHPIDPTAFWSAIKSNGIKNDQSALGGMLVSAPDVAGQNAPIDTSATPGGEPLSGTQVAHQLLVEFPGFYGIVAAADAAEAFTPWKPPSLTIPPDTGDVNFQVGPWQAHIAVPGITGAIQGAAEGQRLGDTAVYALTWIGHNITAILLRGLLILLGIGLLFALIFAAVRRNQIAQAGIGLGQAINQPVPSGGPMPAAGGAPSGQTTAASGAAEGASGAAVPAAAAVAV